MHLRQSMIIFKQNEKYELQTLMNCLRPQNMQRSLVQTFASTAQDLQFKNQIIGYIKTKRNQFQDKDKCIEILKELLISQKCLNTNQQHQPFTKPSDEIYEGIHKLQLKILDLTKNHEIFQIFISFIDDLKTLKARDIYQFQYKLSKANKLSRIQKQALAWLAKRLTKLEQISNGEEIQDQVTAFFNKIVRYGINQDFPQFKKIDSSDIKSKCLKFVEYLQNNYIDLHHQLSPVRVLLKKLSVSIYDKNEIINALNELPNNLKPIFQPLCSEILRIRDSNSRSMIADSSIGISYLSYDMKKAQQTIISSMKSQLQQLRTKNEFNQAQIKKVKYLLQKLSHVNNLFRQQGLYEQIQNNMETSSQQIKIYIQRIYKHLRGYEQLTNSAMKFSFVQRKDKQIDFLQQKLKFALQELDQIKDNRMNIQLSQSILLDQISATSIKDHKYTENQLIIQQYKKEIDELKFKINDFFDQIAKKQSELAEKQEKYQKLLKQNTDIKIQIQSLLKIRDSEQQQLNSNNDRIDSLETEVINLKKQKEKCESIAFKLQSQKNQIASQLNQQIQILQSKLMEKQLIEEINSNLEKQIEQLKCKLQQNNSLEQMEQIYTQTSFKFPQRQKIMTKIQQKQSSELTQLKKQNQQYRQEIFLRRNQQQQLKRVYKQQKNIFDQITKQNNQLKQKIIDLSSQYQSFKKKTQKTEENSVKMRSSSTFAKRSEQGKDSIVLTDQYKRLQEKYYLLQKNFQEIKKFNDLLKSQYNKLKENCSNIIKTKVKEKLQLQLQKSMKNFTSFQNLQKTNEELIAKITILQQENLNLKMSIQSNKSQKKSENQLKQSQILSRSQKIKRQGSLQKQKLQKQLNQAKIKMQQQKIKMHKQLHQRQQTISFQRIQILKLQQKINHLQKNN